MQVTIVSDSWDGHRAHYRSFYCITERSAAERRAFRDLCEELNDGFGDGAGVRFDPLGWEDTLSRTS